MNLNITIKKYLWYVIAAAILAAIITWGFLPTPVKVETASVKYGPYTQSIEVDAKTRATHIYTITAPVSGKLLRINLTEGDSITKNAILAFMQPAAPGLLDVRTEQELQQELGAAQANYDQVQSELEQAKASLDIALSDLKRKQQLANKGFASKADLEHTELESTLKQKEYNATVLKLHAAEHNINKIKASLSKLTKNNQKTAQIEILSPITGKVLRITQKSETTLPIGASIMELADVARLEIVADVLSTDAAQIPQHAKVLITNWGGTIPLEGKVKIIEPSGFTKISALGVEEQRVNVIIDITSPQEVWKNLGDGYKVDIKIILFESPHALIIPMSAVFREGDDWATYVAENSKAIKKKIKIKWHNPDLATIEKGLNEGDQVILYPSSLIYEGAHIKQ